MNELTPNNEKKNKANKRAFKFLALLLGLYFIFSQANLFMNSVLSSTGRFYNQDIANHFNYIQTIKTTLLVCSVWIIKLFGFYAIHNELDILVVDGPLLRVNYDCIGLGVMSFFTAFIIAFPAKLNSKINILITGTILIFLLNVFRIAGLGILCAAFKSQRANFTYHHEAFNIIVYICILILLYFWTKSKMKPTLKDKSTNVHTGS